MTPRNQNHDSSSSCFSPLRIYMDVVNFVQTFGKAQYCFNTRKIGFSSSRTLDSFNICERFSKTWKIWLQVNGFIVTEVQEMQQGGNSMLLNLKKKSFWKDAGYVWEYACRCTCSDSEKCFFLDVFSRKSRQHLQLRVIKQIQHRKTEEQLKEPTISWHFYTYTKGHENSPIIQFNKQTRIYAYREYRQFFFK